MYPRPSDPVIAKYDVDGNGELDIDECRSLINEEVDKDHDGKLSADELKLSDQVSHSFNTNLGANRINTWSNYQEVVKEMKEDSGIAENQTDKAIVIAAWLASLGIVGASTYLLWNRPLPELAAKYDKDKDGKLSEKEWLELITKEIGLDDKGNPSPDWLEKTKKLARSLNLNSNSLGLNRGENFGNLLEVIKLIEENGIQKLT